MLKVVATSKNYVDSMEYDSIEILSLEWNRLSWKWKSSVGNQNNLLLHF